MTTIDRAAYFAARREGMAPMTAAYAARPAALDLSFSWHYQVDGETAHFTYAGRDFRVALIPDEDCRCSEMVQGWRDQDENIAWLTPDEFDATDHQMMRVDLLDANGDEVETEYLGGMCTLDRTPTERRLSERYVAETARELADQTIHAREARDEARAARLRAERAELVEVARRVVSANGVEVLADVWQTIGKAPADRPGRVAATFFAIVGDEARTLSMMDSATIARIMDRAEQLTP